MPRTRGHAPSESATCMQALASVHAVSGSTAVSSATAQGALGRSASATPKCIGPGCVNAFVAIRGITVRDIASSVRRHVCRPGVPVVASAERHSMQATPRFSGPWGLSRDAMATAGRPSRGCSVRVHCCVCMDHCMLGAMCNRVCRMPRVVMRFQRIRSEACFGFCRTSLPLAVAELLLGALPLVLLPCGRAQARDVGRFMPQAMRRGARNVAWAR
jgi:hypothetical protein